MERRILEPAEGNPFFLEELVRSLVDAGRVVHDEQGWRFDHDVAARGAAHGREGRSSRASTGWTPGAREALVAASVLGRAVRRCRCSRPWSAPRTVQCGSRCST